jgi:hypothetical protein
MAVTFEQTFPAFSTAFDSMAISPSFTLIKSAIFAVRQYFKLKVLDQDLVNVNA